MKIIDNFLDKEEFKYIQEIIMSSDFPWFYNRRISGPEDPKNFYYFTHNFYKDNMQSSYFSLWKSFLNKIDVKALLRIKGGLYPSVTKSTANSSHIDYTFPHKGCIFYINKNNGPTYFGKKKVMPEENRVVFFDPHLPHSSSRCSDEQVRITITFNYF